MALMRGVRRLGLLLFGRRVPCDRANGRCSRGHSRLHDQGRAHYRILRACRRPGWQSLLDGQRLRRPRRRVRHRARRNGAGHPQLSCPTTKMSRPSRCTRTGSTLPTSATTAASADFVRVYFFTNPRANGLTVTYHAYDFRYPDGPHNAETLLVDESGRLFIVTKGRKAAIYEAPAKPDRQGVNELEKVGSAPSNVTDGTFLPGGDRIALLTYSSVEVIDATSYEVVDSAPIPDQPQAESLTLSLDQESLLVGSEGKKSKVYSVPVPSEASATPTPGDSTDPGAESDVPENQASSWQSQRGTLLALGTGWFRGAGGRHRCRARPSTLNFSCERREIARRRTENQRQPQRAERAMS